MDKIIKTQDLIFSYEDKEKIILDDINLEVNEGEFWAVLGRNGCGKSTLAKHFNAILLPVGGKVYAAGMDTSDEDLIYNIRQTIGMVFQNPDNQIVATVTEEDVAFAPENLGVSPDEIRRRVDYALEAVSMSDYKKHATHLMSGGQKQRVAIAGVIAMMPRVIVMDEPTAMLDPQGRKEILDTIRYMNRTLKITVILITHYMDEAAKADMIAVMNEGKVVAKGTPMEIFSHMDLLKSVGLSVPQSTELAIRLVDEGYDIHGTILSPDECCEAIDKMLEEYK